MRRSVLFQCTCQWSELTRRKGSYAKDARVKSARMIKVDKWLEGIENKGILRQRLVELKSDSQSALVGDGTPHNKVHYWRGRIDNPHLNIDS